jgi:molybdate transport system ATP-binding protein
MPPLLELDNVTLRAGDRPAFRSLSWTIRRGERWAVIGPNGSGKSLLAAALCGQVIPSRGEIRHRPEFTAGLVSPHTHRAVVAQESSFYQSRWHSGLSEGHLAVRDFLSQEHVEEINPYEVNPHRTPRAAFLQRRRDALDLLGIRELWQRKLIYLSNGEMRKILLARALVQSPDLLVLDDPFAGLDAASRKKLGTVLHKLMQKGPQILVLSSRPDEIPTRTTHLLLLSGHRVIAQGTRKAVCRHPLIKALKTPHLKPPDEANLPKPSRRNGSIPQNEALIEIRNVTINYNAKPVLRDVTWTVRQGEQWALLGPNGAGKTTLLSLIQGDNPQAYAQDIRHFGISPDSTQALWQARQFIGWLSPELHLHYPSDWTCLDVVCSGFFDSLGLHQHCSPRQRRLALDQLSQLNLSACATTRLGELPLGDQRLALLARALVKSPRLLILDEPCQGLDRRHRSRVLQAADSAARTNNLSLIFVSHHQRELPACITHTLRLKSGRVVSSSPRSHLPSTSYFIIHTS